jgi:signal transduction histidine kinase/CheY-like chemotaxis protein
MSQDQTLAASLASAGASLGRILVVDDDYATCSFCARALSQAGYAVVTATEVEPALAHLRSGQPLDLLLADIQIPGLNGLELARIAREGDPTIAIIIMTGHATLDALHQTARRGVADFLTKPFEIHELQIAVDQALHKRQLLQESIRLRAVEQLLHSSEALNGTLNVGQLCQVILDRAHYHVPASAIFLLLVGADGLPAQVIASPPGSTLLPLGQAAALDALRAGAPRQIAVGEPICELETGDVGCGVAVPLRAQGQAIGALLICGEPAALLVPSTQDTLTLLANQAGTALRNAQLYGELQAAYRSLRELDRLKSEFIAIASHELRSPLAIVLGYTKMVRDRSEGPQHEFAQRALESAEQIKTIVDTMVRLRDYDMKRASLSLEPWRLADLIDHAIARLAPLAEQKGQQIGTELPAEDRPLLADRDLVLLVIGNLVDNAIKFTPAGGRVQVSLSVWPHARLLAAAGAAAPNRTLRQLEARRPTEWAVIAVVDNGIGIPREQQARIFDRFFQIADSLTRSQGGVGLGLALAGDLAELQGGLIWVESEANQGSRFSFALPYAAGGPG